MKVGLGLTALVLSMLVPVGCAIMPSQFQVEVDSINASGSEQKSYLLLPGQEDVIDDDRQFSAYADQVHPVLKAKGFVPAESFRRADVVIFLSYGVGDPQEHLLTYSLPTWDRTLVFTPSQFRDEGTRARESSSSGGHANRQGYGNNPGLLRYQTHERFLLLDAFDLQEHRRSVRDVQLWRTSATSTGKRDDLRRVFPALLAAAQPYIATDSSGKVEVKLLEDDQGVVKVVGRRKIDSLALSGTQ